MKEPSCDILRDMSPEYRRISRDIIIRAVLATDMARHHQTIDFLKKRTLMPDYSPNQQNPKDKELTMNMFFHNADISNSQKPWHLCQTWTERLFNEFFIQGDSERAMGLAVSPMSDRRTVNIAQLQIEFYDHMIKPIINLANQIL